MHAHGTVTSPGAGIFMVHLPSGVQQFATADDALSALEAALHVKAAESARDAGVADARFTTVRDIKQVDVAGQSMFIEATVKVTAQGRPRIAIG
jgi:hypothetical protein